MGNPTWVSVGREKERTVLLSRGGVMNSGSMLDSIGSGPLERFRVGAFERRGHGHTVELAPAA